MSHGGLNTVIELEISLIPPFFHIADVLAAIESSIIEFENSQIRLQSTTVTNELKRSLIVQI